MNLRTSANPNTTFVNAGDVEVRDLNGNGVLDVYEDPRAPIGERVEDLLAQMTQAEKIGLMFHPQVVVPKAGIDARLRMSSAHLSRLIEQRHLNHFNIVMAPSKAHIAAWHNRVQRLAESTRLGIPVTVSSDPRHAAGINPGAGIKQEGFSEWPSQLGLAAIGDDAVVESFGDIARREFMAIGIRTVLNPMADVATEPRWGRVGGTFGDDFDTVGRLCAAYIRSFQGGGAGPGKNSVSCMVKHFPGGGPQEDGTEPHFSHGKNQVYPAGRFRDHLEPFRASFEAGARQVMLSYGIPVGQTDDPVAMAFNREIVHDLLRNELGFDGIVCTDWIIHEPEKLAGLISMKPPSDWGVGHFSVSQKYQRSVDIGVDQFGGQSDPSTLLDLVQSGQISEKRIDDSARRILRLKFELGLFDNPYVAEARVAESAGTAAQVNAGLDAQRKSVVLLKNKTQAGGALLPLSGKPKIYSEGIDKAVVEQFGEIVGSPDKADVAILSLVPPSDFHFSRHLLSYFFAEGSLAFKPRRLRKLLKICRTVATVVNMRLDRPAVIPEIASEAHGLFVSFGIRDLVLMEAIFGQFAPSGRLPVEMPASMQAVLESDTDSPGTVNPLFSRGHGLSYEQALRR